MEGVLSGQRGLEILMVEHRLPPGYFWVILETPHGCLWGGPRKVKIRDSGMCQVSACGMPNNPGELWRGKTSTGERVVFVWVKVKRNPFEPAPPVFE